MLRCCFLTCHQVSLLDYDDARWTIAALFNLLPVSCLFIPDWLRPGTQLVSDVFVVVSCCFLGMLALESSNLPIWFGSVYLGSAVMMFGVNSGALFHAFSVWADAKFLEGLVLGDYEEMAVEETGDNS